MCNTYNISRMNKLYAIYYISYIYACDLTSCIYTYSTDIKKVSKLAPNGAKTEKSPHTPHSFWMCKKQLPAPYRNSIAQFKNRPRPFERGHPRYLSRPKSVTLSVANSQKKGKIPNDVTLLLNLHNKLAAQYRNSTAKFKIRARPIERRHPCYKSRPESVTLAVANSQKTNWNRRTSCTQRRVAPKRDRVTVI